VNLYGPGSAVVEVRGGPKVKISQETDYPFGGKVTLKISPEKPAKFTLYLRIPGWCRRAMISGSKGLKFPFPRPGKYVRVTGTWEKGSTIVLDMDVKPRMILGEHGNKGNVAVQYGPLVLAADAALNPGIKSLQRVAVKYRRTGANIRVEKRGGKTVFAVPAFVLASSAEKRGLMPVKLYMTAFADAGAGGASFKVWLREHGSFSAAAVSLFSFGKESYPRKGNVKGEIADGETTTFRVTFNGRKADMDWYAVTLKKPAKVNRVVYAHGKRFHDGGWFDASAGKPKIQILRRLDNKWETVAELKSYPSTTATNHRGIREGQEFSVSFPTVETYGIRIVGKPAHGDDPNQAFSSCAELQAFLDK